MKTINTDNAIFFDCDNTLVMWHIKNPKVKKYDIGGFELARHDDHIQLLKDEHARGQTIVVWSAGGTDWAETVVRDLRIKKYVHYIMAKPTTIVDDLPIEDLALHRIYMPYMNAIVEKTEGLTFDEAVASGCPLNRAKYTDGWYRLDRERGIFYHTQDLSARLPQFTPDDKEEKDWKIKAV